MDCLDRKKNIKILKTQKTYQSKVIGRIYPMVDELFAILIKLNIQTQLDLEEEEGLNRKLKNREKRNKQGKDKHTKTFLEDIRF